MIVDFSVIVYVVHNVTSSLHLDVFGVYEDTFPMGGQEAAISPTSAHEFGSALHVGLTEGYNGLHHIHIVITSHEQSEDALLRNPLTLEDMLIEPLTEVHVNLLRS